MGKESGSLEFERWELARSAFRGVNTWSAHPLLLRKKSLVAVSAALVAVLSATTAIAKEAPMIEDCCVLIVDL